MRLFWQGLAVQLLLFSLLPYGYVHAVFRCPVLLTPASAIQDRRELLFEHGRSEGLPMFGVAIHGKPVPVILLNKQTIQSWNPALQTTFGIATSLEPGNDADHGHVRLPGGVGFEAPFAVPGSIYNGESPTAVLMDLFSPAQAGNNAINGTGYRYKSVSEYFKRRKPDSKVLVDIAYSVSPEDQARIWLYHSAKRIALVRIQYAFDQPNDWWISQQRRVLQQDADWLRDPLTGGFEQCNNSRLGANALIHTREMRGRMAGLFNQDVNVVYGLPETKRFLDDSKKDLLFRDWRNQTEYNPNFLDKPHYIGLMQKHFNSWLSHDQKVDALSYLLATNIFDEVVGIRDRLGIVEARKSQYGNPNMTAILLYSDSPGAVGGFYSGQYEYLGASSGNGFSSSYFNVIPTYAGGQWPQDWTRYVP